MLETVNDLPVNEKKLAREPIQALALLHYVFTLNNFSVLSQIAETANRHGCDHPKIRELFLTSTLSLIHRRITTAQEVN